MNERKLSLIDEDSDRNLWETYAGQSWREQPNSTEKNQRGCQVCDLGRSFSSVLRLFMNTNPNDKTNTTAKPKSPDHTVSKTKQKKHTHTQEMKMDAKDCLVDCFLPLKTGQIKAKVNNCENFQRLWVKRSWVCLDTASSSSKFLKASDVIQALRCKEKALLSLYLREPNSKVVIIRFSFSSDSELELFSKWVQREMSFKRRSLSPQNKRGKNVSFSLGSESSTITDQSPRSTTRQNK